MLLYFTQIGPIFKIEPIWNLQNINRGRTLWVILEKSEKPQHIK